MKEIIGPVTPIPTPFDANLKVDLKATEKYCDFLLNSGIRNIMTTVGTSRFNLLQANEIEEFNAVVAGTVKGRGVSIVANPPFGSLQEAIRMGEKAEKAEADYYLVIFPDRFYGDDNTYSFFSQVANQLGINCLIHEMPLRNGFGPGTKHYSLELLERLFEIKNIVGLKEEALDAEHSRKVVERFAKSYSLIGAGGGMSRYLGLDSEFGSRSFLGGIGGFLPKLEINFFEQISSGNLEGAKKIVEEIEKPFFEQVCSIGWHPSLKAALSIKNLMPKFERVPMKLLAETEYQSVREAIDRLEAYDDVA